MAQTSSRRAILAGIATAPIAGAALALPSDDVADLALRRWIDAVAIVNDTTLPDRSDEAMVPYMEDLARAEDAVRDQPPSIMAAAGIVLVELSYAAEDYSTLAGLEGDEGSRALVRILACVRPHLSGTTASLTADTLDHPDRPLRGGLLLRAMRGEA